MSEITLRDASGADALAIARLHAANWRRAYPGILRTDYLDGPLEEERLQVWRTKLADSDPAQEIILAEEEPGTLAGFACLYHDADPRWGAFLDNLHTAEAERGRGLGKRLLGEAARRVAARDPASGLWLFVFEKNLLARGFYAAQGGHIVERIAADWDAARGQTRLRCHWPSAALLAERLT